MMVTAGCGGAATLRPRSENLIEVPLGAFRVPLAPRSPWQSQAEHAERNGLLLRFELHALVPSGRKSAVLRRAETHEVRVRNEVINACRSASLDELSDPSLGALKARLTQAVAKHFGPKHVRRVVISHILLEPI